MGHLLITCAYPTYDEGVSFFALRQRRSCLLSSLGWTVIVTEAVLPSAFGRIVKVAQGCYHCSPNRASHHHRCHHPQSRKSLSISVSAVSFAHLSAAVIVNCLVVTRRILSSNPIEAGFAVSLILASIHLGLVHRINSDFRVILTGSYRRPNPSILKLIQVFTSHGVGQEG